MRYAITRSEAGDFVVSELRPVVLGHFVDEAMAAFFVDALEHRPNSLPGNDGLARAQAVTKPSPVPAPVAGDAPPEAPRQAEEPGGAVLARLSVDVPAHAPDIPAETLAAAFQRLDGGEKLADVAVAFGLSMGRLRGYWALECKRRRAVAPDDVTKASCRLCGTEFVPSAQNLETCARCSR